MVLGLALAHQSPSRSMLTLPSICIVAYFADGVNQDSASLAHPLYM
jgi:hypothetical protein